jgi:hypothetical protein
MLTVTHLCYIAMTRASGDVGPERARPRNGRGGRRSLTGRRAAPNQEASPATPGPR